MVLGGGNIYKKEGGVGRDCRWLIWKGTQMKGGGIDMYGIYRDIKMGK